MFEKPQIWVSRKKQREAKTIRDGGMKYKKK